MACHLSANNHFVMGIWQVFNTNSLTVANIRINADFSAFAFLCCNPIFQQGICQMAEHG